MNQVLQATKQSDVAENHLVPYATQAGESRGRLISEMPSATRSAFHRDRDRIIHSGAFRKLRNKTQVFIENEGDYYRTRLTHSLEVAQIARSVARALRVDEDLAEAIALAHDLGHTCFGHAGEAALDEAMQSYGGFNHNEQTFRILTQLEHRYAKFDGLNLCWETLEGIVKHNGPLLPEKAGKPVPKTIREFTQQFDLELASFAGPEAQIAAIADDIAYNTHDFDDGFRAGYFTLNDLAELPLFGLTLKALRHQYPDLDDNRMMHETVREVIGYLVTDLITTTRQNIAEINPRSAADIRLAKMPVACLSTSMQTHEKTLRAFLWDRLYRHSKVNRACSKAESIVKDIFNLLIERPSCLPQEWFAQFAKLGDDKKRQARLIADYIAGMTDRYAVLEHRRLFSTETMI